MAPRVEYTLVTTPAQLVGAVEALAGGRGPYAIDTERASAFRYDDRAFLVQIFRRDAGTFLIAPEGFRDECRAFLAPLLSGGDWILHAAGEDLAALALLGLHPGRLFDTELAARLAGFERPNLGAVVEHFTGIELEKSHGREDWSQVPLESDWLDYAALDVAYLNDIAEALAEVLADRGLLAAAEAEFDHLITTRSVPPAPKTWRDAKGIAGLRTSASLQIARALWRERDAEARDRDVAPSTVLRTSVLIEVAKTQPKTRAELARVHGFPARRQAATARWFAVIQDALSEPKPTWPVRAPRDPAAPPARSKWEKVAPESFAVLSAARLLIADAAKAMGIAPELLLAPAVLRQAIWNVATTAAVSPLAAVPQLATDVVHRQLRSCGARQWQADIASPLIARAFRDAAAEGITAG